MRGPAFLFNLFYRKKRATPPTAMNEPTISLVVNFSLKKITAGGIINTGTMAIMVEATHVVVYRTERSEKDTPRKGPKKAPIDRRPIA